jgi:hypothetical protein
MLCHFCTIRAAYGDSKVFVPVLFSSLRRSRPVPCPVGNYVRIFVLQVLDRRTRPGNVAEDAGGCRHKTQEQIL